MAKYLTATLQLCCCFMSSCLELEVVQGLCRLTSGTGPEAHDYCNFIGVMY